MNFFSAKATLFFLLFGCQKPTSHSDCDLQNQEIENLKMENQRLDNEANALHVKNKKLTRENKDVVAQNALWRANLMNYSSLQAVIDTSMGEIRCDLYPQFAPLTVSYFVGFAEGTLPWKNPKSKQETSVPLYNGTIFHRVIPGFMIQGGDPLGDGTGGPGFQFADELTGSVSFDIPGRLAMANSGANTNGSQFFITTSPRPELDRKHTIFGSCLPLKVVNAIAQLPTNSKDRPDSPPTIKRIGIVRK